ncbi:glycosyltransferase [Salinimicrobium sp. MT39]|uniref:Glycosyltransferase n=1 Tax=Salinimicrobium profundisediminis TaxID=2994553 RepID=A0A9X3I0J6_9FLAO|nr:glycosyltransferase [Salinimicrobium profundisediminis]MCX2837503.1 glycosyltransferase [Salinimicrobium profundisediminis]
MKFAIFSHVEHIEREGRYYAYAPYMREMKLWLKYVEEVEVVAPRPPKGEVGGQNCYQHENLTFNTIPSFHFLNLRGALKTILKIPYIHYKILGAMKRADHLHLRCPGNIGLLACICQIFFPSKPKSAKYAGNWDPEAKQPWSYRFQKWLLSNTFLTRNMQVLVYGEWPEQSRNIIPFFTASFSEREKTEVPKKAFSEPFIFLFVGNLVEGKRPLEAIKFAEEINKFREGADQEIRASYIPMKLELYGDGPEREKLETYVRENHLEQLISIKGNRPLEDLKKAYQKAHFVILPSKSEGWPKALAEGMFFGCIPIATPVSCVPWMLDYGSRGVLLEDLSQRLTANGQKLNRSVQRAEDRGQDVLKIAQLLADQEEMEKMSEESKKWSQHYTLERFEEAIKKVLLHPNDILMRR